MTGAYCVFAGLPSLWTDLPIGICVLEGFNQSHNLIYIAANLRRGDIYNRVGQLLLFGGGGGGGGDYSGDGGGHGGNSITAHSIYLNIVDNGTTDNALCINDECGSGESEE